MVFTLLADVDQCPVVIDGAGTLGRQIASVYAAGGEQGDRRPVRIMPADARTNRRTTAYANLTTEVGA
jgi:3-hydroxyacyl-CoA dehydrogenase